MRSLKEKLERYLNEQIPISQAMGIKIKSATPQRVLLFAPLSPNINHKKTAFGGSLHAAATLCCWSLLHMNLVEFLNEKVQIVITHSEVTYLSPVDSDFEVECIMPEQALWESFIKICKKKGKGRIELKATIFQNNKLCVDYQGTFVALKTEI